GAVDQVLQPAAAAVVADDDVQLAVGAEVEDAAVVVAGHLGGVAAVAVVLEGVQADQVLAEGEGGAGGGPDEAGHAVAQQGGVGDVAADGPGAALGPVQEDVVVAGEIGAEGDAEQAALGVGVDRQVVDRAGAEVEAGGGDDAVDDVVDLAGVLLQHE